MDEMESKLNAILGNPELMQQIMSMAQTLGNAEGEKKQQSPQQTAPPPPSPKSAPQTQQKSPSGMQGMGIDLATIQKIAGLAQKTGIDQNQRALLRALQPYLSRERITRLERAMRAAKMASAAGFVIGGANSQGR